MFNFSSKTYVNKEYKLSDFLKQIKANKEVKEDAKKIDKIIFENVISANSMNVEEEQECKNIYVIRIKLKIGVYREGTKKGQIYDHGTSFEIKEENIDKMFTKYVRNNKDTPYK